MTFLVLDIDVNGRLLQKQFGNLPVAHNVKGAVGCVVDIEVGVVPQQSPEVLHTALPDGFNKLGVRGGHGERRKEEGA